RRAPPGFADVPGAAGGDSGKSRLGRAVAASAQTFAGSEAFRMTWMDIYLICFLVGVALSVVSLLGGSAGLHLPHVHIHFAPHIHMPQAGAHVRGLGPINFGTIAA